MIFSGIGNNESHDIHYFKIVNIGGCIMVRSLRIETALKKLGRDMGDLRKRRRISTSLMAERMGVTRVTLSRIEKGDPKVNMGAYAMALFVLGKIEDLEMLADRTKDPLGLDMMDETLPKRIRSPRGRRKLMESPNA
jgi:transcriptional regulator with XRE-family HTH domain